MTSVSYCTYVNAIYCSLEYIAVYMCVMYLAFLLHRYSEV